jgi:hypothetical protein
MQLREFFYEWTATRVFGVLGLFVLVALILFAWTNIGAGPSQEVKGVVRSVGMDTGTKMSLPRYMATIETSDGKSVLLEVPTSVIVAEGSEVVVRKTQRLLTDGHEYQFMRLAK